MPRFNTSPYHGAYKELRTGIRAVMQPLGIIQHSRQHRSLDKREQHPQGNDEQEITSTSSKRNADSNEHSHATPGVQDSQVVAGSTRTTTSPSITHGQGTTSDSQTNNPRKLIQAGQVTSSTSTAHRQSTTSQQQNSGTTGPTEYQTERNGSVANPSQLDASLPTENPLVVEPNAGSRPRTNDADNALENVLSQLDQLSLHETQIYKEKIRERKELQRLLRECLGSQEKEYRDVFNVMNIKMQNIERERDDMQKRMKIMQDELKKMQQQLHAKSIDQPDPIVMSTSTFTPHTADGVSGQDLIQYVERLNDEIFQFAALLADEFEKTPGKRLIDLPRVSPGDFNELEKRLGRNAVKFVLQAGDRQEHSWVMHAVQAFIIASCKSILMSLFPLKKRTTGFEDVHRKIRSREGQGTSGQWRSLVCRHGLDIKEMEQDISECIKSDIQQLCRVLGCSTKDSAHRESLKSITSKTLHLHGIIYVEILSGDITIISPELGRPFDPDMMEVTEARSADATLPLGKPILCTTDMGLMKSAIEEVFSNERYEFKEYKTVILKAKVFLDPSAADGDSSSKNNSRNS